MMYSQTEHDELVSIIMPSYNTEDYIAESVDLMLCNVHGEYDYGKIQRSNVII